MGRKISYLLDTNVLVRFLVGDNPQQLAQAKEWFGQAQEGRHRITISSLIVAESCFVLESFYHIARVEIVEKLQVFLGQRWLNIPRRKILLGVWPYYLKNFHFVDAYLVSRAKIEKTKILTFDVKLKKQLA